MAAEEEVNRLKHQLTELKKVEVYPENLTLSESFRCCFGLFVVYIHFQLEVLSNYYSVIAYRHQEMPRS